MSDASTFGWALRQNGSCLDTEEDCGVTVEPYRVCCPGGSYCPNALNVACCPSESNCTEALEARPHCANSTWDLYINGGYFCCEQGTTGYAKDGGSDGCGSDDNSVRIWNAGTRTQRRDLRAHTSRVNHVAFSSDGRQLASTSDDGSVRIWSLTDDYALGTFGQRKAKSVSFSSDGKFLAGLGELTPLRLWQKTPA
ncbi:WD40-repeat-containing domain protein [Aspergillus spectabilis]